MPQKPTFFIAALLSVAAVASGCHQNQPITESQPETGPATTVTEAAATPCDIFEHLSLPTVEGGFEQCSPHEQDEDALTVTVSILPQEYFVRRIAGDHVRVNVMVPPGASPATYEPTPEQLTDLSQSQVYFAIGVPFEASWMSRIQAANPDMTVVDTSDCTDRMVQGDGQPDPHIWLSPQLVKQQARAISQTFSRLDCTNALEYQANLDTFLEDIDTLDSQIQQQLADATTRSFIVFHPSWGYFARDYGLEMIPISVGGQEPSAAELTDIVRRAKQNNIKVIFAQPEFSTRAAETIADEIGGEVLLVSPLAPDWLTNMEKVADTFAQTLSH
jgi:zinc transport system substrate-binding protein